MPKKRRLFFRSPEEKALDEWRELSLTEKDHRFHLAVENADLDPEHKEDILDRRARALGSLDKLVETHENLYTMQGVIDTAPEEVGQLLGPKMSLLRQAAILSVREASQELILLDKACQTVGLPGPIFEGDHTNGAGVMDAADKWYRSRTGRIPASLAVGNESGTAWDYGMEVSVPKTAPEKSKGFKPLKIGALDEAVLPVLPEGDLRNAAFDTLRGNGLGRRLWAVEPPNENGKILVCSDPDYIGKICAMIPESKVTYEKDMEKNAERIPLGRAGKNPEGAGARCVEMSKALDMREKEASAEL